MRFSTRQKYRVPERLVRYLMGEPEPECLERLKEGLMVMQLDALPDLQNSVKFCDDPCGQWLEELALQLVEKEGIEGAERFVGSVVAVGDTFQNLGAKARADQILEEYADSVFTKIMPKERPVRGPFEEATIELKPGAEPVKQRPFHLQGERREALAKMVDQLIEEGKLEPGKSAWSSPAFPVPKKRPGEYRLVVDYRALNDATIADAHPLPRIEDILQRQSKHVVWTVLDMKDGYHQVPLRKEDRHVTSMSTPNGTMQWTVLVMGLKNGGAIFQRMMEWVLHGIECVDVYIDDVIVGTSGESVSEALDRHERDVRRVLDRLAEYELIVDPKKAHFFCEEVEFCGNLLRDGKRRPAPGKLLTIQKWELPKTVTQLRGFLGLTNYYSCYVPNYAEYAGPLMSKLQLNRVDGKKGSTKALVWKNCEKEAFEKLKAALAQNLELYRVDPDKPFIMKTDASDKAIGAVLEQQREVAPGRTQSVPVAFFSRKLGKSQLNWTPREKETYAIVSALRKWAGWIGLQPVLILTDHKSLEDWVKEKMETPSGPAGRRARWHETLSKFDLTVQYMPGSENVVADALSRYAYPASKAFQDTSFHGSEEARLEMKEIIEEELREGRAVGMITGREADSRYFMVAGTMSRRAMAGIPPQKICAVTRSGRRTSGDAGRVEDPRVEDAAHEVPHLGEGGEDGPSAALEPSPGAGEAPESKVADPLPQKILEDSVAVDAYGNEIEQSVVETAKAPGKERVSSPRPSSWLHDEGEEDEIMEMTPPTVIPPVNEPSRGQRASSSGACHDPWDGEYEKCAWWGERWRAAHTEGEEWPESVRLTPGRMIWDGKVCVPGSKVEEVLREYHNFMGHVGIQKVVKEVSRRFAFPPTVKVYEAVREVSRMCVTCQACDPPNWSKSLPISHTPVPGHVMTSVAMDVFDLPCVKWEGQTYDALLLCVDRLSGWIIGRPCRKLGLAAERAAHLIMDQGWDTFGIPSVITSD